MPIAVSKLVSEKLGRNENNNAHRIFKGALIYGLVIGVICGLIAFFGEWLASTFVVVPSISRKSIKGISSYINNSMHFRSFPWLYAGTWRYGANCDFSDI